MIEEIYEPPISVKWFQRELDRATRDTGQKLRIVWAPNQVVAKVIDRDGRRKEFKKYPVLFGSFASYIRGRYYSRMVDGKLATIAYQKASEQVIPSNVLLTDIALPDIEEINPSVHIFIIERKLPNEQAKEIHEQKRFLARKNLGFDLFGEFPKEGVWDWFADVSEHRGVMQPSGVEVSCCEIAQACGVRCQGLYRPPDYRDVAMVKASIAEWKARPKLEDKTPLIEQAARDLTQQITEWENGEISNLLDEARECEAIDKIAQERTRIAIGVNAPIHRQPY